MIKFLVIVIVVILLGAGVGYYFFAAKSEAPAGVETADSQAPRAELSVLIPEKTISPILSFSGETVWFFSEVGRLYRKPITPSLSLGAEEYLLPELVSDIREVEWQASGGDFIVKQNTDGHTRYRYFSEAKKEFKTYPDEMREPRFLESGNKIIYDWINSAGGHELYTADLDASNYQKVTDLYSADYRIEANPAQNQIALFSDNSEAPVKLSVYDLATNKFQDYGEIAAYDGVRFSPDGKKLLAGGNGKIVVYNLTTPSLYPSPQGGGKGEAELSRSFPPLDGEPARLERSGGGKGGVNSISQIVWEGNTNVVYATETGIYQINIETSEKKTIYPFSGANKYKPRNLLIHPSKPLIFFTDSETGYLYKLEIKN